MSSWFNVAAIAELTSKVTESDAIKELTNQVQNVSKTVKENIPDMNINNDTLLKLSLMSPELVEQRKRIYEEEKRKEMLRDSLAGTLPWETHDTERDILVEECREAILNLSVRRETFTGPFLLPPMPQVRVPDNDDDDEQQQQQQQHRETDEQQGEVDQDQTGQGGEGNNDIQQGQQQEELEEQRKSQQQQQQAAQVSMKELPSPESLEKLAKLEPLPSLLSDFDMNSHVGLIKRLLTEDPKLVEMQAKLSGGGEREIVFWKNYFFNCAFTRYEAGLSIDEIWSEEAQQSAMQRLEESKVAGGGSGIAINACVAIAGGQKNVEGGCEQTTIVFNDDLDSDNGKGDAVESGGGGNTTTTTDIIDDHNHNHNQELLAHSTGLEATLTTGNTASNTGTDSEDETGFDNDNSNGKTSDPSIGSEYELISDDMENIAVSDEPTAGGDAGDDVLDELEAEIARELED